MSWYYCLEHHAVEPEDGCANSERMGPYATREDAEHALELAAKRTAEFDAEEEEDN
jgi:HEPN domain-containing protein